MRRLGIAAILLAAWPAFAGSPASAPAPGCAEAPPPETVQRFAALPGLHESWAARSCFPPTIGDDELARRSEVDGVLVGVNGRPAFVRHPGTRWTRSCDPRSRAVARPLRTTGRDLLRLQRRIESTTSLRERDLLEIGLGRARMADGSILYSIYLATRERAVRLQCYADFDAAIEQAGTIFRRDEHAIAQLYDFLHVERGSEDLSTHRTPSPAR